MQFVRRYSQVGEAIYVLRRVSLIILIVSLFLYRFTLSNSFVNYFAISGWTFIPRHARFYSYSPAGRFIPPIIVLYDNFLWEPNKRRISRICGKRKSNGISSDVLHSSYRFFFVVHHNHRVYRNIFHFTRDANRGWLGEFQRMITILITGTDENSDSSVARMISVCHQNTKWNNE